MAATTRFELVTPNRTLFSGEAEMVVCRAVGGEIAFLAHHMPYIGALDPGLVRVVGPVPADGGEAAGEPEVRIAVRGGFVEVKDNQVIMLADEAEPASEIDLARAQGEEAEAQQRLAGGSGEPDLEAETALRWAQARIQAVVGEQAL